MGTVGPCPCGAVPPLVLGSAPRAGQGRAGPAALLLLAPGMGKGQKDGPAGWAGGEGSCRKQIALQLNVLNKKKT